MQSNWKSHTLWVPGLQSGMAEGVEPLIPLLPQCGQQLSNFGLPGELVEDELLLLITEQTISDDEGQHMVNVQVLDKGHVVHLHQDLMLLTQCLTLLSKVTMIISIGLLQTRYL